MMIENGSLNTVTTTLTRAGTASLDFTKLLLFIEVLVLFLMFAVHIFMPDDVFLWNVFLVAVFVFAVLISFTDYPFNHFQVYLFFLFAFNVSLPFLVLFGLYVYPDGNNIMASDGIEYVVQESMLARTYAALSFSVIGSLLGWTYLKKRSNSAALHTQNINALIYIERYFYLVWLLYTIYSFRIFQISLDVGYVGAIHLAEGRQVLDSFLGFVSILYVFFLVTYVGGSRTSRGFIFRALLALVPFVFISLAGSRGHFLLWFFVFMLFFQYRFRSIKIIHFLIALIPIFAFVSYVGLTRFDNIILDNISLFDIVLYSIINTGSSIGVIAYTFSLLDHFKNSVPFLFGYIDGVFSLAQNYTYAGIEEKSYLAQHLIFELNENKFYSGSTIGTAMVAEMVELLGLYFYPFISLFYFVIFATAGYLIRNMYRNIYFLYLTFNFYAYLIMSPRDSLFRIFNKEFVATSLVIGGVYLFNKFRNQRKRAKGPVLGGTKQRLGIGVVVADARPWNCQGVVTEIL